MADLSYGWVLIYNPDVLGERTAFGPFPTFEAANTFPNPPGISDDTPSTITRLNEPAYYEEGQ